MTIRRSADDPQAAWERGWGTRMILRKECSFPFELCGPLTFDPADVPFWIQPGGLNEFQLEFTLQ
jgi:hypothetical protein